MDASVRRYYVGSKGMYLIYTYHGIRIQDFPAVEEHLRPFKTKLEQRATQQAWYELQQPQHKFAGFMDGPKIITPDMATAPRFALDETGFYSDNTTYFIPRRDRYLLGLLNSRLAHVLLCRDLPGLEGKNGTYLRFFGQYMENFPVRRLRFVQPSRQSRPRPNGIAGGFDAGPAQSSLPPRIPEHTKAIIQRQVDATDAEIDRLVYDLYSLTKEEIEIIEGPAK